VTGVAAARKHIRAVTADEKPAPKRQKSVTQAADGGTSRELLVALRTRIAKQVEDVNCPPRDLASLSRRLLEIAKEIEALDAAAEQEAIENDEAEDEAFDASAL
jgi:hypothetical protein